MILENIPGKNLPPTKTVIFSSFASRNEPIPVKFPTSPPTNRPMPRRTGPGTGPGKLGYIIEFFAARQVHVADRLLKKLFICEKKIGKQPHRGSS